MTLPSVLKMMAVFVDGGNWMGEVPSFTPPKLGRQMEEYRGPYDTPIDLDMGGTKLEAEFKTAGRKSELATKIGQTLLDGTAVRFIGSFQTDHTGGWETAEIYVRGRVVELDRGEYKVGEIGEETTKLSLTYYREVVDGRTIVEIDVLNHKYIVNGVDRLAEARRRIGI